MTWEQVRLRDVAVVSPTDPPLDATSPFVPMDAVEIGVRHPTYYIPREARGGIRARPNDVLFARITPSLENGKVGQVPPDSPPVGGSTEFLVIRPGPRVDPGYLYYWSLTPAVRSRAQAEMAGTTGRMRLGKPSLEVFDIAIPPLAEQRRIVNILEDHLSRLDAATTSLEAASHRIAAWVNAETDLVLWPSGVATAPVSSLIREPLRNGRSDRAAPDGRGTKTLTITAVTRNDFSEANTKVTLTTPQQAAGLWLEPGDIFVQRSNTPELVGSAARFDGAREWAIFPDLLIRLRADESKVLSEYLVAALRSRRVHHTLRRKAKGLAGSMPKIDQGAIGSTLVPIVPLSRQSAVVARLQDVSDSAAHSLASVDASRRRAASLRRSLLAAAFRGEV